MTKFFYIFLLNLLLLNGILGIQAGLLDHESFDRTGFSTNQLKRNTETFKDDLFQKSLQLKRKNYSRYKRQFGLYGGIKKSFSSSYPENFQKFPFPSNNIRVAESSSDQDKPLNEDQFNKNVFAKTITKWEDVTDLDNWKGNIQKGRENSKRETRRKLENGKHDAFRRQVFEKQKRYLDYTNSQMPFNEGKLQQKKVKTPKVSGKYSNKSYLKRRMILGETEIPFDEGVLEYSRVRRYLDGRTKKQTQTSTTLEDKEAAMSGILDPNLNLDGVLVPHVRKRREWQLRNRFSRARRSPKPSV